VAELENTPDEVVAAKGSSPLPAVLSVLSLLVGGAALVITLTRSAPAAHAPADGEEEAQDEAEPAGKGPGPLFALTGFIVNLADRDSGHYLKLSVSIELPSEKALEKLRAREAVLRDGVLMLLSGKTVSQVQDTEGKQALRAGISALVEEILGGKKPRGVFFTEFVVQ